MSTTLTIRTDETLRNALKKRAATRGLSVSELVRDILQNAVAEGAVGERAGHLKGKLVYPEQSSERWRMQLREKNWRS